MRIEAEFTKQMEAHRKALGLTIEQNAERAGISDRQYRYYLSGSAQPMIGTAMRLSAALAVDMNAIRDLQRPDAFGCYPKDPDEDA